MSNKTILYIISIVFFYLGWGLTGLILDGKFDLVPLDALVVWVGYTVISISGEKDNKEDDY